jgi:hypothetical protein
VTRRGDGTAGAMIRARWAASLKPPNERARALGKPPRSHLRGTVGQVFRLPLSSGVAFPAMASGFVTLPWTVTAAAPCRTCTGFPEARGPPVGRIQQRAYSRTSAGRVARVKANGEALPTRRPVPLAARSRDREVDGLDLREERAHACIVACPPHAPADRPALRIAPGCGPECGNG